MRPTPHIVASACLAVVTALPAQEHRGRSIDVRVDRRTELMSIVFRLAGNPEYSQPRVESYATAVDEHFGEYRDHPVVERAKQLRRTRGVSFDAPMSLAVHLADGGRDFRLAMPLDPWPENLDQRWTKADAKAFVRDANRFARKADFDGFMTDHGELYELACAGVRDVLDEHTELGWFDEFFGARPDAQFTLSIGLLNGGANYGPRMRREGGKEELYSVLGVWQVDQNGAPRFDESVVSTIVHEFCHSYCNPLIDVHLDALQDSAEALWPHVADSMERQAYGNWQTMMRESLVRACVARYQYATRGERALAAEIADQKSRDFLWVGDLSALLAEYEADRQVYPELGSFMPKIVEFFDGCPARLEAELERVPLVTSIVPAVGRKDVDPHLDAIVVTFDRRMLDRAWAVVGGGPHFPELTGSVSYDESRTVLTIPVRLKPDWSYELWLNRGKFDSFQSADRVKLRPVHVTFETRSL